ncbi:MATE family efflux transporter [Paragemmobacter ruber]|uniref:Multidrug-efflux transporter n=1 Tax=Paragemmobacter ruber TaxID=1985673 RepID=A0ABW9Y915_9RHOB|nr:MATE family efflux transporter [Rhodobacter ruber]NBE09024.1 MATE family efflux transporter [Rhodobacter ruber]
MQRAGRVAAIWREVPGIVGLALPIVMGLAASTLIGVTDSLMLAPLGPVPLAAVGLTGAVAALFYAAIYGLLSALSVRIGAAWGAGEGRAISGILRSGLALGALVGIGSALVMAALWPLLPLLGQPEEVIGAMRAYWFWICAFLVPFAILTAFKSAFEAVEKPWLGTAFAFLGVVVNVPLNYALIWGLGPLPQLGLTGAGLASFLAETIALGAAFLWWRSAPSMRRLRLRRQVALGEMGLTFREGAPLGAMYVVETASVSVATLMIGAFGTVALAGNQVAQAVGWGLLYMLPLGVAGAVAIRVAQERGAGNAAALRPIALAAVAVAGVWLVAAALTLALRGEAIARLVTDDPEVVAVAAAIFLVFAPMQISDAVQSAMLGALRGLSDTAWPAMVSAIAYWPVALPLGYALAHWGGMGPSGIWAGYILALAGAGAALAVRFWRKTALLEAPASA